jgi:hypothetical protein
MAASVNAFLIVSLSLLVVAARLPRTRNSLGGGAAGELQHPRADVKHLVELSTRHI